MHSPAGVRTHTYTHTLPHRPPPAHTQRPYPPSPGTHHPLHAHTHTPPGIHASANPHTRILLRRTHLQTHTCTLTPHAPSYPTHVCVTWEMFSLGAGDSVVVAGGGGRPGLVGLQGPLGLRGRAGGSGSQLSHPPAQLTLPWGVGVGGTAGGSSQCHGAGRGRGLRQGAGGRPDRRTRVGDHWT